MSTLATTVNGLKFTNSFVIGSGPPGTNVKVIKRAFKEGWGGVIAKTVSPRYGKLMANDGKEVIGWEKIRGRCRRGHSIRHLRSGGRLHR